MTKPQRILVTGAAGFIGSHLVERLLQEGCEVVGFDNFSTGRESFLEFALRRPQFTLVRGDLSDAELLQRALKDCSWVYHLAANADVRFGTLNPRKDLEQNTIATSRLLEAMREAGVRRLAFASTGSIYGETFVFPTPEDAPFPIQTSFYGASKLACEGLIAAYCEGFDFEAFIFRFVSVLGERYTHGHVYDFFRQLLIHPQRLRVLGDGSQKKSYLYVGDCIAAMRHVIGRSREGESKGRVHVYNLGTAEYCEVKDSVRWICDYLGLKPEIEFTGSDRGWVGDNPFIFLDTRKIRSTDWSPTLTIHQAVIRTLEWLKENQCAPTLR